MFDTYANSEYAAYTFVWKSHKGAEAKFFNDLLRKAGFRPRPSVLSTELMGSVVLFFVNLLGDVQEKFEMDVARMREARYEVDSEAGFYKMIDFYVMSILLSIHEWYDFVETSQNLPLRIEHFVQLVFEMTTKSLTERMIRELTYSSPRMDNVLKARACAYILNAMQRDYESAIDILKVGQFEKLFGGEGTFNLVRDDVFDGIGVETNAEEIQQIVRRMEAVIEEKAPFIGQTFESKRGGHTVTVLESTMSGTMKLRKEYSDGTKEIVEMSYTSFCSKYVYIA